MGTDGFETIIGKRGPALLIRMEHPNAGVKPGAEKRNFRLPGENA